MAELTCPTCGSQELEITISMKLGSEEHEFSARCKKCGHRRTMGRDIQPLLGNPVDDSSRPTQTPAVAVKGGGRMEIDGPQSLEPVKLEDLPEIPEIPADQTYGPLLDAATAEVYRRNAFRIIGLGVEASAREISKQVEKLKLAARLGTGTGINEDEIRDAVQRLQDPERRLVEEIFWFWPLRSGEGDAGLEAAARGDWPEADAVWRRDQGEGMGAHNLAVLRHWQALDFEEAERSRDLKPAEQARRATLRDEALCEWSEALNEEAFWARIRVRIQALDDPRLNEATLGYLKATLPTALLGIEARLAVDAASKGRAQVAKKARSAMAASGFPAEQVDEAMRRALRPIRERIRKLVEVAGGEADRDPPGAKRVAEQLLQDTKPLLDELDALQEPGETLRDGAHDEVALGLLNAQIAYGNKTEDWTESIQLLSLALPIAASESARQRITRNHEIVKKNQLFDVCWWCGIGKAESEQAVKKAFHRDVQRIPTGYNQVRVTWRQAEISVPRCPECAARHVKAGDGAKWSGGGVGLLLALMCIPMIQSCPIVQHGRKDSDKFTCGCFFFLLVLLGVGGLVFLLLKRHLLKGLKGENWADQFPSVKEKVTGGWSAGAEPATQ